MDVRDVTAAMLKQTWKPGTVRLLAGCAPCQPFSPYRRGADTSGDEKWPLLDEFARLAKETLPELITMENVPRLGGTPVFERFVQTLRSLDYWVSWQSCYGPSFGLPQHRRRLVLIASRLGPLEDLLPDSNPGQTSVRNAIGHLPPLEAGQVHGDDPLHVARKLSDINIKRIQESTPGGTWLEWPEALRAPCHRKKSGASFRNVYARMQWDQPSPTITTLAYNFGAGRFGHPEQDRALTLREAAVLQGFPSDYIFTHPNDPVTFLRVGRMIGNAVPPPIAQSAGNHLSDHVASTKPMRRRKRKAVI